MIRFAQFRLDTDERRLSRNGEPLELGGRAFDLLLVLVTHAGQLVSKAELMDRVWPDVIVEEANLHVQMTALRKAIGRDAIATVPGRGYQFVVPLLPGDAMPGVARDVAPPAPGGDAAAPSPTPAAPPGDLPVLLGREEDLAQVARALAHPTQGGFVTITGAGGSGKTLLARHLTARFGRVDGRLPLWVDLLELDGADALVAAVAQTAGVEGPPRSAAELARALASVRRWLVLDNAEHVLQAVGELCDALRREARGLTLLITSQAPLRRTGETVHLLGGLAVPAAPCTAEEALRHAAVALFVTHGRQADRRFRFGDAQVEDVVAVCRSLAGSALGVQLAAGLLGQMPLSALRSRLARPEVGPEAAAVEPSANVLRSALAWSHDLLTPQAQRVFRRLAVAQGPMPLPLVRAIAGADGTHAGEDADVIDTALSDLVDRSLVQCETDDLGTTRYRLLEAPRALALERLHEAGERQATLLRLAHALAPLGDALHKMEWNGERPAIESPQLSQLRVAWADAAAAAEASLVDPGAAETTARIARVLAIGAALDKAAAERLRWATALRNVAATSDLPPALRARLLDACATLIRHSDMPQRQRDLLKCAEAWREAGDVMGEFRALARAAEAVAMSGQNAEAAAVMQRVRELEDPAWPPGRRRWRWFSEGVVAVCAGDLPRARHAWQQQLELIPDASSERLQALHSLANAEQIDGDTETALPRLLESVAIARRIGRMSSLHCFLLPNLVAAQLELGDLASARVAALEGWPHAPRADAEAWWADHVALLAAREGRHRTAARLLGLADATYARLKDSRQALEARSVAAVEASARSALGDAEFEALRAEGEAPAGWDSLRSAALADSDTLPVLSSSSS